MMKQSYPKIMHLLPSLKKAIIALRLCAALAFIINLGVPVSAWALGVTFVPQDCNDGCTAQYTLSGVPILSSSYTYCNNGHGGFRGVGALNWCTDAPAINGSCGSANGGIYSSAPHTASYLCNIGTPSAVSGTGPWSWSCTGFNGGTPASCSANLCGP